MAYTLRQMENALKRAGIDPDLAAWTPETLDLAARILDQEAAGQGYERTRQIAGEDYADPYLDWRELRREEL